MKCICSWGAMACVGVLGFSALSAASGIQLSGKIHGIDGKPLSGVSVSLTNAGLNTNTDSTGAWRLDLAPGSGWFLASLASPGKDRVGSVSGRQDTLRFSLGGTVRLRDTVSVSQAGIVRVLDTTINAAVVHGYLRDSRDGQMYRTVKIGTQVWMAENLNYPGAEGGLGRCYDNRADSCAKYGRLYAWKEAMQGGHPASGSVGVKGLCPTGWHVPSDAEWTTLTDHADASGLTENAKLKAITGWNTGNGSDDYGFHALPGGVFLGNSFEGAGRYGDWWSATESDPSYLQFRYSSLRCLQTQVHDSTLSDLFVRYPDDSTYVWSRGVLTPPFSKSILTYVDTVENAVENAAIGFTAMDTTNTVTWGDYENQSTYEVSGLAAGAVTMTLVKVTNAHGNSLVYKIGVFRKRASIPWTPGIRYGNLKHHGQSYRTVQIGSQTWMAENLNDSGAERKTGTCFRNDRDFCIQYGRLYSWAEALGLDDSCNVKSCSAQVTEPMQGICPTGWHVPSAADWAGLNRYVQAFDFWERLDLRAGAGWDRWESRGDKDSYGFRALPGGIFFWPFNRYSGYSEVGAKAYFWGTSEYGFNTASTMALSGSRRSFGSGPNGMHKNAGLSLRCLLTTAPVAHDSTLSALVVSGGGTLSPPFSKSTLVYADTVANAVSAVRVDCNASDSSSKIAVLNSGFLDKCSESEYGLSARDVRAIRVKVTNANGNSLVYTVKVFRKDTVPLPIHWTSGITYGSLKHRGQSYRTVQIGSQTWMAENLNDSGASGTQGNCVDKKGFVCGKYGRLYTWAEALGLDDSCKMKSCSAQVVKPIQGICPSGWHVPSDAEWTILKNYVDSFERAEDAKLKAAVGGGGGNGGDEHRFRTLPGGFAAFTSTDSCAGSRERWWSSSEEKKSFSWFAGMFNGNGHLGRSYDQKWNRFLLRCLED